MKKEYIVLALMLLLILIGLWFFFFRGDVQEVQRLETPNLTTNNLSDTTISPDGLKNYEEIMINNGNVIPFYIGESIPDLENGYTVSSAEEEVAVSKRLIKVLRPFDLVKLTKKEQKTGDALLMALVLRDTNEVTINARSSAIAMVAMSLSEEQRNQDYIINKISANAKLVDLVNAISLNLTKSYEISPMDFNTYPELSTLVELIKNDVLQ